MLSQASASSEYKADVKHLIGMVTLGKRSCPAPELCRKPWKISVSGPLCCIQPMACFDQKKIPYSQASFACFNIFKLAFMCVKLDWGRNCIVLCWEKMLMSLGTVSINGNVENDQLVWSSAQIGWFSFSAAFSVPADMSDCINVVGEWGCKIPSKIQ